MIQLQLLERSWNFRSDSFSFASKIWHKMMSTNRPRNDRSTPSLAGDHCWMAEENGGSQDHQQKGASPKQIDGSEPPMAGNGFYIPPIKWWWLGDGANGIVLPTKHGISPSFEGETLGKGELNHVEPMKYWFGFVWRWGVSPRLVVLRGKTRIKWIRCILFAGKAMLGYTCWSRGACAEDAWVLL